VTVAEALREATERLVETSDTARLDAELLMAHALGVSRSDMLLRHQGDPVPAKFARKIERRAEHEPVAYIVGHCDFYGREFRVNSDVLIPRPDSEAVIDAALEVCPDEGEIIDLGTGSGALLLTLLAEKPGLTGLGVDRSAEALWVARENAEALGLSDRCQFSECDWTKDNEWGDGWFSRLPPAALVIANPPYVESSAELAPNVAQYEPAGALFAGPDGLDDYRIIIPSLREFLLMEAPVVLEIGHAQAESVGEIAENEGFSVDIRPDLANRPRALILR